MGDTVFLLLKDCLALESLPCYGNAFHKTPNIDALAEKGTVYEKYYTAGGSTAMAMSAMLTGHYPYEFKKRKLYVGVEPSEFPSIFDTFQNDGYECHIIWDKTWINMAWRFVREFGDETKTVMHNLDIAQATEGKDASDPLKRNPDLEKSTYKQIYDTVDSIDFSKKQFVLMHLPHILKGRRCYADDLDMFDEIVGYVRKKVGDDSIFLTSDHGHMNMHKGLIGYGFYVYEPIIHIPLITPRYKNLERVDYLTCNVDLPKLFSEGVLPKRDYAVTDTAYRGQPHRVTAITAERFKYVYNKADGSEELYDLLWDKNEDYNILKYDYYDKNRGKKMVYSEHYFYPYYDEALKALDELRKIKDSFWVRESRLFETYGVLRKRLAANKFLKRLKDRIVKS